MDEYTEQLEQLLAEWQDQSAVQNVIQNILDEPIPEATKKRLLKPLLPKPIPAPRKRKLEKRQTVLREFDPLHDKTKPKLRVKRSQLLSLVADQNLTKPPHYILLREVGAGALTDYGATVPVGHRLEADALAFLNDMTANTTSVIEKDLNRFGGLKFTLVLTAALEKLNPGIDDNVKPDVITTIAFFRSKVETVLNSSEIMFAYVGSPMLEPKS